MKNLLWLLTLGFLFTSCDQEELVNPEQNLTTSLNLNISKPNSSDTKAYPVLVKEVSKKFSDWSDYSPEGTSIVKSVIFNAALPTGEALEIEIWFHKLESAQLLKLDENATTFDQWKTHKEWDYLSYDDEVNNFYSNSAFDRRLIINKSNVMFGEDATFNVVETAEVNVNGESKTRVTIKFKGDLYPYYSSRTPEDVQYRVEGEFSGIIE